MTSSYTPGAYRVGLCTKCAGIITLGMPAEAGRDIDALLAGPRECTGNFHVELSGFGDYFWPWRRWPEFTTQGEAEAFAEVLRAGKRDGAYPFPVREAVARGRAVLAADGRIVPRLRLVTKQEAA